MSTSPLAAPRFSNCCSNGDVAYPPQRDTPPELTRLLFGNDATSKEFRKNSRKYNSVFQMASTQAKKALAPAGRAGPNSLRVNKMVHHQMGQLLPAEGAAAVCAQIYFCDPNSDSGTSSSELNHRVGFNGSLNVETIAALQHMLHRDNHFVQTFKAALADADADSPQITLAIEANSRDIRQVLLPYHVYPTKLPKAGSPSTAMRLPRKFSALLLTCLLLAYIGAAFWHSPILLNLL